jgi:outer membrane autotransporter protein
MKIISLFRHTAFACATLLSQMAQPVNPEFQTTVDAATGAICGSTSGASPVCTQSDLSGVSEDSMAPTQALASNEGSLEQSRKMARNSQSGSSGGKVDIGPFSLLVNGRGNWFSRDRSALERGYDGTAYSAQLGLDKRLSIHTVLGGFLAFERTDSEFDRDPAGVSPQSNQGETRADNLSMVIFGAHNLNDALHIEGAAGYGDSDYEFTRTGYYQPTGGGAITPITAKGNTSGKNYWLSLGSGYEFASGAYSLTPSARLTYARSTTDGYSETELTSTGLAMRYDNAQRRSLTTTLGLRVGMTQSHTWGVLVPYLTLEYEHEFKNDPQTVNTAFVLDGGNNIFTPQGQEPDRDYFHLGAGTQFILPGGWISFVELEALLGNQDLNRSRLNFGFRKEL